MRREEAMTTRPFDLLNDSIGKDVLVVLKDNLKIRGNLKAFDVHMNIVLENAEVLENDEPRTKYGKIIVRGDNILLISA